MSTASLLIGVAAAEAARNDVLVAGLAGLVAGAMSMAAGEYVSVSSQADTEAADLERERRELANDEAYERRELAGIYRARGLEASLADEVARQLMAHDALGAHARDELGIVDAAEARPREAALVSALAFAGGASLPLASAWLAPAGQVIPWVLVAALACLLGVGALSARVGGAPTLPAVLRVTLWGLLAMGLTALMGSLTGALL